MGLLAGPVADAQLTKQPSHWLGLLIRLILGFVLLVAGAIKIGNLAGNVASVEAYRLPLPHILEQLIGWTQPFLEIAVGLLLIIGLFTRVMAALGWLAMAVFIFGITWAWANGLDINCGCFSPGGAMPDGQEAKYLGHIILDGLLAIAGFYLMIRPAGVLAVDNWLLADITIDDDTEFKD